MLAYFRAFAKSWVAKILFVLLIISFGLIFNVQGGVQDALRGIFSHGVITTSGRSVEASEFKQVFDRQKKQIEEQNGGQPLPPEVIQAYGLPQKVANDYASDVALEGWMKKIGLKPSDKLVGEQMQQIQAFANPATGAFDKNTYLQALARAGVRPDLFEQNLRTEVAEHHLQIGFSSAMRLPRIYGAFMVSALAQTRDLSWFSVNEKIAGPVPAPTDADLQKFLAENNARYRLPDMRAATVVLFSPALIGKDLKVSDAEMQDYFVKARLAKPETRSFVQIAATSQAQAQSLANAIKGGAAPAAVAQAAKLSAVTFDDKPQAGLPFPKVAAAVFAMKPGDVAALQGDTGWVVVKLNAVSKPVTAPTAEQKKAIEAKVREDKAKGELDDLATRYDAARAKGMAMADAAKSLNLPVFILPLTTADGRGLDGQPANLGGQPVPQDLLKTLFDRPKGAQTEVEQAEGGVFYALHVDEVAPSAPPPFAKIHDRLAQDWRLEQLRTRLHAKAEELAQRVRKGESIQAVAASVGAKLESLKDVKRPQIPRGQDTRALIAQHPELIAIDAAFGASNGEVVTPQGLDGFDVVKLDGVHTPDPAVVGDMIERLRPGLSGQHVQDLYGVARQQVRAKMKTKVMTDRLNAALGLPDDKADAKKGKAK